MRIQLSNINDDTIYFKKTTKTACWKQGKPRWRLKGCAKKKRYRTEDHAKRILRFFPDQSIYSCPFCHGWHLTKRVQEETSVLVVN